MKKIFLALCVLLGLPILRAAAQETNPPPVRIAIIGLVHGHVRRFIPAILARKDIQLAGIVEPDQQLAAR